MRWREKAKRPSTPKRTGSFTKATKGGVASLYQTFGAAWSAGASVPLGDSLTAAGFSATIFAASVETDSGFITVGFVIFGGAFRAEGRNIPAPSLKWGWATPITRPVNTRTAFVDAAPDTQIAEFLV